MIKEKWNRFLNIESDLNTMIQLHYYPGLNGRPFPYPENYQARIDWALQYYEISNEIRARFQDDLVAFLSPYTGTEIFAEAFGCRVVYPGNNMPFARPMITDAAQVAKLKVPDLSAEPFERMFSIARTLREKEGPNAIMQLPDIQSPFDIAALIWNKEDFFAALIEEPDAAMELVDMTESVLTLFLDEWFREFGTDFVAHYPEFYMPCGISLSEDEAGSLSPNMFRKYCTPSLTRLSQRYGGLSMHCCANSEHQWQNFADIPGIKMINICQNNEITNRSLRFFGNKVPQFPGASVDESKLGICPDCAHVVVLMGADSDDSAKAAMERMCAIREKRKIQQ